MKIEKIAQKLGGKLWQKGTFTRIYFQPRKDISFWIEVEDFDTDDDFNYLYIGSKIDYKFTTENVSENWIKSQWKKFEASAALILAMFIVLSKGYKKVYNRLGKIEYNGSEDEFFQNYCEDFVRQIDNLGDISKTEAEQKLLSILEAIKIDDDDDDDEEEDDED
jgi:hypothetical protein